MGAVPVGAGKAAKRLYGYRKPRENHFYATQSNNYRAQAPHHSDSCLIFLLDSEKLNTPLMHFAR